jgi:hypothetical protein
MGKVDVCQYSNWGICFTIDIHIHAETAGFEDINLEFSFLLTSGTWAFFVSLKMNSQDRSRLCSH